MALPTTEEFEFQELENSGDFRVLRLHPAKSRSEPIIFDLEHLSLSEPPKFDAISYTWDGQAFEHEAYSSGKRFLITRNCRDILVNMRLPNHSCMLWIDQICIDQSSEKDRSNNICQMACIYEQATSVVIWTGQCDGRITSLISRMEESLIKATRDHGFDPRLVEFTTQHGDEDLWIEFLHRPWFHRMWTFQEFTMTPRENIALLLGELDMFPIYSLFHVGALQETFCRNTIVAFNTNVLLQKEDYRALTLFDVLHASKRRACSDPKDKIFAIYSIVQKMCQKRCKGSYHEFPTPDYTKDIAKVFTEATAWSVSNEESLEILYLAPISYLQLQETSLHNFDNLSKLPTWVPNLVRLTKLEPGIDGGIAGAFGNHCDWDHGYSASLDAPKFTQFVSNPPALKLRGVIYDTITAVGAELPPSKFKLSVTSEQFNSYKTAMVDALEDWFVKLESAKLSNTARFWNAIFCGNNPEHASTKGPWMNWCFQYFHTRARVLLGKANKSLVLDSLLDIYARKTSATRLATLLEITAIWAPQIPEIDIKMTLAFHYIEYHCLIITRQKSLGLALGAIEEGDVVAIVAGLKTPIVLRKRGEKYALVGYTVVPGIMRGEAWPSSPEDLQEIDLE